MSNDRYIPLASITKDIIRICADAASASGTTRAEIVSRITQLEARAIREASKFREDLFCFVTGPGIKAGNIDREPVPAAPTLARLADPRPTPLESDRLGDGKAWLEGSKFADAPTFVTEALALISRAAAAIGGLVGTEGAS